MIKATVLAFFSVALALAVGAAPQEDEGVPPVGADGKPLNVDFETGTLKDWTATGSAFEKQPVKGDTVAARRGDMKSQHKGDYWIGTFEVAGDAPVGTLVSVPFKVTHPWCSFLVAGGTHENTCVELIALPEKQLIAKVSGDETESLKAILVELTPFLGKEMFIRLVDQNSGAWGHINFDHFRFYEKRPKIGNVRNQNAALQKDQFKFHGLPPEEAAKAMTLPDGFKVTLSAGEPEISQPIAMALDERGRLWVAQNLDYPIWHAPDQGGKCAIYIFEDTKGDGKLDKKTLFADNINFISGMEVGYGGAWVGAPPYLLFIPDRNHDDKPDGPPEIVLDGFEHQDTHETLNAFIWGPDGWLYGCHGVFTYSNVGKPGCKPEERQPLNASFWRYHPLKKKFEVFAEGASNQWGMDFNDQGQAFGTACVIPHLYHVIQGGRYQRQGGKHFNPYTYDDIKTIADHRHYVGSRGPHAGNGLSDSAGGGHAHCGAMVYLGGNWPDEYRNKLFFNNVHGGRINMDVNEAQGSGYVGKHGPDFIMSNDSWSQILNLRYGPDGSAYMIDWYDKQQCHTGNPKDHDKTNGRIFKVSYKTAKPASPDLGKLSNDELVALTLDKNDWYVRHARKVLGERQPGAEVHAKLDVIAASNPDPTRVLRAMWALHVTGGWTDERALRALGHANPYVRAWAIQLSCEDRKPSPALLAKYGAMAASDESSVVRLYLASAAGRIALEDRRAIVEALIGHAEDANDQNLPLMYWYAVEPIISADPVGNAALAAKAKIPRVREFIARRLAAGNK